ncbi:MAG: DRTGG domain-containing protein [Ignavibacteriales bacterium]|nr:DRTGG domain-containing protein [Ignavibacteriales bacterium]
MTLQDVIARLNLTVLTSPQDFTAVTPKGGYASDLLSCVVAEHSPATFGSRFQAHMNVVAVAALREVSAVIITENAQPDADVVGKANEQGVVLLATTLPSYEVAGIVWEMGIR